ncbi:MAG TPA: hypothetical protein VF618_00865 [Thermoanaerobaculia bacterium]
MSRQLPSQVVEAPHSLKLRLAIGGVTISWLLSIAFLFLALKQV